MKIDVDTTTKASAPATSRPDRVQSPEVAPLVPLPLVLERRRRMVRVFVAGLLVAGAVMVALAAVTVVGDIHGRRAVNGVVTTTTW